MTEKTALDREAPAPVVEEHLGLVHACAHRFRGRGVEYEDLYGAGCIGLVKAAAAFDRSRGVKFSTYAVPVILGEIRRLFRDGGSVKVSRSLKELGLRVTRAREEILAKEGREPTVARLAALLGEKEEAVVEAISAGTPPVSLTESEEEGGGQMDLPVDSPEETITDLLSLDQAMDCLAPLDRQLITLRYFGGKTQTQTAQELGMTQVQVSRREKKILLAMRRQLTG